MISAKIVADSITPTGDRLTTLEVVFPRYILAEKNTHRMLSRNSASSRAIPYKKMVKEVLERPFIPYAFQEDHTGVQGTVYLNNDKKYKLPEFANALRHVFKYTEAQIENRFEDEEPLNDYIIIKVLEEYCELELKLTDWWLLARDKAVEASIMIACLGITKQLANRLLEPFMYHKVLVSGTEWENFFNLRCPSYQINNENEPIFKSWKDLTDYYEEKNHDFWTGLHLEKFDTIERLQKNKGQADIHMMFLAEAIYDAMNESIPKELKEGEWHIPYGDNFDKKEIDKLAWITLKHLNLSPIDIEQRISIARCARLSYQTLGDNPVIDYEADLKLYDILSKSGHWSPFEHVAKVMTKDEYFSNIKGNIDYPNFKVIAYYDNMKSNKPNNYSFSGWCRNYRGFIQYRELLDN